MSRIMHFTTPAPVSRASAAMRSRSACSIR
jgi:hypothetical protein